MHYKLRVSWKTKNKQSPLINIMMPMYVLIHVLLFNDPQSNLHKNGFGGTILSLFYSLPGFIILYFTTINNSAFKNIKLFKNKSYAIVNICEQSLVTNIADISYCYWFTVSNNDKP